jgi:hypothetical protein
VVSLESSAGVKQRDFADGGRYKAGGNHSRLHMKCAKNVGMCSHSLQKITFVVSRITRGADSEVVERKLDPQMDRESPG